MALELFEGEIMNIPHSLSPDCVSLYHGTESDIAKRFDSDETVPEIKGKSALVLDCHQLSEQKHVLRGR